MRCSMSLILFWARSVNSRSILIKRWLRELILSSSSLKRLSDSFFFLCSSCIVNFEMISTVFSISSTSDFLANDVLKFSFRLSTIVMASPTPLKSFLPLEEVV